MEKSSPGDRDLVNRSRGKNDQVAASDSVAAATVPSTSALTVKSCDAGGHAPPIRDPHPEVRASVVWERAIKKMQQNPDWSESLGRPLQSQEQSKEQCDLLLARLKDLVAIREIKDQRRKVWVQIRDTALATLKVIGDLGTAVTALNPYAALAWGTIQFLITTAINASSVGKLFWENIRGMAILVSKYQTCELVYLSSAGILHTRQDLEDVLERLYTALLSFQVHLVLYARSGFRWLKAITLHAQREPQKLLEDIIQCEKDLNQQLTVSNGEIVAATYDQVVGIPASLKTYLDELQEDIRVLNTGLDHISKAVTRSERLDMLRWISPILTEDSHTRAGSMISLGTTDWIFATDQYREWAMSDSNTAMWLHGSMGTGKSCVTHTVIEERKKLSSAMGSKFALAYFYFDGTTRPESGHQEIKTSNILACLVKQIVAKASSKQLPEPLVDLYHDESHERSSPSESRCLKLLSDLCGRLSTLTLLFDGLDECPLALQRDLLDKLQTIFITSEATVKIFIASRKEGDIPDMIKEWFTTNIDITQWTEEAIYQMVQIEVLASSNNAALRSRYYNPEGKDQSQNVIEVLQKHAGGMFRWVRMALDYLHDSVSYGEMAARLGELHGLPGLFDLYSTIYRRMMSGEFEAGRRKARAIETTLNFILHGMSAKVWRLPPQLPLEVIVEACDFNEIGNTPDYTAAVLAKLCPSFVVLEAEGGGGKILKDTRAEPKKSSRRKLRAALRFPHFSVREYLLAMHPGTYSRRAGNAYLASLCMGPFNGYDVSFQNRMPHLLKYCATHWVDHICIEKKLQHHADKPKGQVSDSMLSRYQKECAKFLPLVGPCVGFLAWHNYTGDIPEPYRDNNIRFARGRSPTPIFARILLEQDLSLATVVTDDLREAFIELRHRLDPDLDSRLLTPTSLAVFFGRFEALKWILESPVPEATMNTRAAQAFEDLTSLSLSNKIRNFVPDQAEKWINFDSLVRVIEHLLDYGAQLTVADTVKALSNQYQIHCRAISHVASKRGIIFRMDEHSLTVVDHLLDKSSNHDEDLKVEIIDLFVEQGCADSRCLDTWLLRAAKDSSRNVVAHLIENGANPLAKSLEGETPCDIARRRLESLRILLTNPLPKNSSAEHFYEERFNSTSIVQYLEPNYVPPEIPVVHAAATCHGCEMRPIIGVRHKCVQCEDFDFCAECYCNAQQTHPGHEFISHSEEPSDEQD